MSDIIITATTICHFYHHSHHHLSLLSSQPPPSVTFIITATTILELFKFSNQVRDMEERSSHLLPFVLDMGKYLSIEQAELLNDEDMKNVMNAIDESGLSLDGKSRMYHALNGYIVCNLFLLFICWCFVHSHCLLVTLPSTGSATSSDVLQLQASDDLSCDRRLLASKTQPLNW